MTPRYRCPFCGSMTSMKARDVRQHILDRHRMLLIEGLGLIEAFTTQKPLDPPRKAGKGLLGTNIGVSGEGDS